MSHFELFDLPEALDIDLATLKANFLNLQQQYHPDKSDDKDKALIKSSEINQAYKALSHVDSRAAYLLSLKKQDHHLDQSINDFEFCSLPSKFVSNSMKQPIQNSCILSKRSATMDRWLSS